MTDEFDQRWRAPREHDSPYMGWIAALPCAACACFGKMKRGVHVAHLRGGSLRHGKRPAGMAEKPDDRWTTPLCPEHHVNGNESQHHVGEERFWARLGLDPFDLCLALNEAHDTGASGVAVIAKFAGRSAALRAER